MSEGLETGVDDVEDCRPKEIGEFTFKKQVKTFYLTTEKSHTR